MTLIELEVLLKNAIGLDAKSIGSASVERAIRQRMESGGFKNIEAYWQLVNQSPVELQELIEAVVIPETWFFRDAKAFVALEKLVKEEWLFNHPEGALRLLSVPCSTGEEPYSMAICLHALGLSLSRFRIDAIDVSDRALARARKAVYGRNSFRSDDLEFRKRYFESTVSGHLLSETIRQQVHFEKGNLLDESFGFGRAKYDFIFCRNLLIYFDTPTQERALATLRRLLTGTGVLFVGPSESGLLLNHGFIPTHLPLAFAFRKAGRSSLVTDSKIKKKIARKITTTSKSASFGCPPSGGAVTKPPEGGTPNRDAKATLPKTALDTAQRLANEGKMNDAAELCRSYIREHGPSAQAFYLLGLVSDAANEKETARDFYRKALYLQPDHYETLVHLALLIKSLGDETGARVLQERALRVKESSKS